MKKATAKHRKHSSSRKKSSAHRKGFLKSGAALKTVFQMVLAGAALLGALVGGVYVHEHYIVVVPDGVTFQGQDMSGKNRPEVLALVQAEAYKYEQQNVGVAVGEAEETQTLPAKDWGVEVDVSQTVERFFQFSSRFAGADVISAASAGQKKVVVPAIVVKDLEHVLAWIHRNEYAPRDASLEFDFELNQWILSPGREGYKYSGDQTALEAELKALLLSDQKVKRLSVKLDRIPAAVNTADLQPLFDQIQAMLVPKISWTLDGQTHVFTLAEHQDMISVDVELSSVELNEDKLKQFIADLAVTIDRAPGEVNVPEPVAQDKGYLKADYQGNFETGRELDQSALFENILAGLAAQSTVIDAHAAAPEVAPFEAKFSEISPRITLEGVGELTLLSQGKSSFALGNIPDRIFNVKKGLGKFDGVVIPAGAEFSFNEKLGIVSYQAGWKPALAIFGGGGVAMTPGGGLCQVSTTMYRAAVWAGLPIKQRKAHSLDVSYYHAYGYGIDATIYPPAGLDLKFVNDTPGPIFIHTYTRDDQTDAYVEFYGVSDGRKIELTSTDNYAYVNKKTGKNQRYVAWDWLINHLDGTVEQRQIETIYYGGH